jgi:hypothetical protein
MTAAIILYGLALLAYAGWDVYCTKKNQREIASDFFSANVKRNVIANVAERVNQNIARNVGNRGVWE